MLDIFVRINKVDMNGYCGRENHPTPDMEGSFVRVIEMETLSDEELFEGIESGCQVFFGILVDANGEDIEDGKVDLIDHEIESFENMPVLFGEKSM